MSTTARAPKGEVVRNPTRSGFKFALRFTAAGKRRYQTLGSPEEGWSETRAQRELERVLASVLEGAWQPYVPQAQEQTFHEFASAWFESIKKQIRPGTALDYENQLRVHLLPFFKGHLLSQITVAEVDRYRETKIGEGVLGATSINKTITRLGQILEVAVERELIARNPAKVGGKRRKAPAVKPARAYLDRAEQIVALLDAAGQLDAERTAPLARRALLATITFAGLRISELIALDWRDVDLAAGRLRVRQSKTDAGVRYVDLLPVLASELRALKATRKPKQGDPVFPSAVGTRLDRNRVLKRVLGGAVARADEQLAKDGLTALPEGLTLHALRRTFASLLIAVGKDHAYVMRQMGHTSPTMTLGLYAQVMDTAEANRKALRALVDGGYLAVAGSGSDLSVTDSPATAQEVSAESAN
ncbi:MAG TPA: site-specific integrase [Solirubrobacteraceae bacterium]|jgi:integrase|nr:site-specific integrase [Solirubrobacteraceae bacterium]